MTDNHKSQAALTWDEQGQPICQRFDDIYFSRSDGLAESNYVFIQNNQLPQRWKALEKYGCFTIAETGFGTGLNFVATWQLWNSLQDKKNLQTLHFISAEKYPLTRQDISRSLALWPELKPYADSLCEHYPPQPAEDFVRLIFQQGRVILTLYFGDASEGFEQLSAIPSCSELSTENGSFGDTPTQVNAWYLDGFAPAKNPEMWHAKLYQTMAALSGADTSFATFTAAGAVKRGMSEAGFTCSKVKGYGRKREMLIGAFTHTVTGKVKPRPNSDLNPDSDLDPDSNKDQERTPKGHPQSNFKRPRNVKKNSSGNPSPWHLVPSKKPNSNQRSRPKAIVIGGGLAGCHIAYALAQKNCSVTLLEREANLGTQASGNQQGVVYTRLSLHRNPLNQFNLSSLIYANHFYQQHGFYDSCGQQCGVMHLAQNIEQEKTYREFADHFKNEPEFARIVTQEQSTAWSGLQLNQSALLIPSAGWLSPPELCRQLVKHDNIEVRTESTVSRIDRQEGKWHLYDADNKQLSSAEYVVVANAWEAQKFSQLQSLPLKRIRGQVSYVPESKIHCELNKVLCGDGYIAPAHQGLYSIGASFNLNNTNQAMSVEDHQDNLEKLAAFSPELKSQAIDLDPNTFAGKVGFRCATPDYFPIVGPITDAQSMKSNFAQLRKNANTFIDQPGSYQTGLYTSLGYGSRGLSYAPLAAEVLASIICGQHIPISRNLLRYLHPARFLIRDLIRNRR